MAQTHPLKFIVFLFGLLILFAVSGTNMFARLVIGQGQAGAVEYMHVDVDTNGQTGLVTDVKIALVDQQGKPVTGRTYGEKPGQFFIPTNGLRAATGAPVLFTVDQLKVIEILDASGTGTGVYVVPIIINSWDEGAGSPVYTLEARYIGGGAGTGDDVASDVYQLVAGTTLTANSKGLPGVLKFAPVTLIKNIVTVPEQKTGQPEPPAAVRTVTFRVKLIGQARDPLTDSRMFTGRAATPEELAKWLPPTAFDSAGRAVKAEYGRIREEQVPRRGFERGQWESTGVYQVEVKLQCPADLAGRKAVITFARQEGDVLMNMSGTVNFQTSINEDYAASNTYFANPYLINPPSSPAVTDIDFAGVKSGGAVVEFPFGTTDYPTNGNAIIAEDGNVTPVASIRLRATISDADGYNISQAEFFQQQTMPLVTQDDGGTDMVAESPGFNSEPGTPPPAGESSTLVVYYDLSSSYVRGLGQGQWDFWPHGKKAGGGWGSDSDHYNAAITTRYVSVDMTKPTVAITQPVIDEFVGKTYHIEGDAGKGSSVYESPLNAAQVYDEGADAFVDADNDTSRGMPHDLFEKWFFDWDTLVVNPDQQYSLRARAIDQAGNISDESTVSVKVDNTKPFADIDIPLEGTGWDNTVSTGLALTGTAYDPDPQMLGFDSFNVYSFEWGSGQKGPNDPGWNADRWTFAGGHAGGTPAVHPADVLGTWDTTGLAAGIYTVRVNDSDKSGNVNLDRTGYPPEQESDHMNRINLYIDTTAPTVTITAPGGDWFSKTISGTASDDLSGVDKVEAIIERNDTHEFWTGSTWVGTIPGSWPNAVIDTGRGTTSAAWHYDGPAESTLPRGTSITLHARATDDVVNIPGTTGHVGGAVTDDGQYDPDNPTSAVVETPTGGHGWFMAPAPSLTVSASDTSPGSGMNGGNVSYVWTTISVGTAPAYGYSQLAYITDPVSVNAPTGGPDGNGVYTTGSGGTMPDGRYRLWYCARDVATNTETYHYTDIKVDTTAPSLPNRFYPGLGNDWWPGLDLGESYYTAGTDNTVYGWDTSDSNPENGTVEYYVEYDTDPDFGSPDGNSGWGSDAFSSGRNFTGLVNATTYYYRIKVRDYVGNESAWYNTDYYGNRVYTTMDDAVPTINSNAGTVVPSTWYSTNQTVEVWATDDSSGPRGFRWSWDADPGHDWVTMNVAGATHGTTSFPGVGVRTLYIRAYDNMYSYDNRGQLDNGHHISSATIEYWYDPYPPYNWQDFSYYAENGGWSTSLTPTCTITIQDDIAVPEAVSGLKTTAAKYAYSKDNGGTWEINPANSTIWFDAACTGSDGSANVETVTASNIPFNQDSPDQNKVKFQIQDVAGGITESTAYTVKIDSTAPSVTATVPLDDLDPDTPPPLVPTDTALKATFNDDMLTSTVNDVTNFTLEAAPAGTPGDGNRDDTPGSWNSVTLLSASYDAGTKTVNIVPATALAPAMKYRLTATTSVKDKAGNPLNPAYKWYWYVSDIASSIDWPYANNTIYGSTPILGVATGTSAKYYKLQYESSSDPGNWHTFGSTENGLAAGASAGIFRQTDWSEGETGGVNPEVVTNLGDHKKYRTSSHIDATSTPGTIRLAKTTEAGAWYNIDWVARKRIDIFNPNASTYNDYQVKMTVNWLSDMKTNFSDLRFTDSNKTSLIHYWIENYTPGVSATVWVEVPSLAPASTKSIYMYYGNPSATATSSVADTFLHDQIFLRTFYTYAWNGSSYTINSHSDFDTYMALMGETGYGFYGSGFVDRVDHDANPYGSSDNYTSQYKFLFLPQVSGNYKFGTNSDAASEVVLNTADQDVTHTAIVGWYGNHGAAVNIDDHSAYYSLTANQPVWLAYRQNDLSGAQLSRMGIMVPGQAWKTVNTTNFAGQIYARNYATVEPTVTINDDSYYEAVGSVTSSVIDGGATVTWGAVAWTERLTAGTDVTVQLRTGSDDNPEDATGWSDWSYPRSVTSGDIIPPGIASARYIQYRINLKSNAGGGKTPAVDDITLFHSPLAFWDTTAVADGQYTIKLMTTISDSGIPETRWDPDNVLEARVTVTVDNTSEPNSTIDAPDATPIVTTTTFDYTGADQTYTVPAGVYSVNVKEWGGGGGGGNAGGWSYGFAGGGSGYTDGDIAVTPGQVLTVMAGGGGVNGTVYHPSQYSYGGGGPGQISGSDFRYGAQGGGRSAIIYGGADLLTAGGGGGGGSSRAANGEQGGAGGGSLGLDGSSYNQTAAGTGGTQSAGGAGGTSSYPPYNGTAGSQYLGGTPGLESYGGGGGGGWYGGGGGAYDEPNDMGGGGGGSGYIAGAGVSGATTAAGSGAVQANSSDPLNEGKGAGGAPAVNGQNGRVVITSTYIPDNTIYYKADNAVTGTATDAFPGIGDVDIRIQRSSDNKYWTGADFTTTDPNDPAIWVASDSTGGENATWTFNKTGTTHNIFASGVTYTISSRATDLAGTVETTPDTITVYGDDTPPDVSLDFPKAPANYVSADYVGVTGSASDTHLKDYKVEYKKDGETNWTQIGSTRTAIADGFVQTSDRDFKPDATQGDLAAGFNNTRTFGGKVMLARLSSTAMYPSQSSLETSFGAAGFNSAGAGVVATDGTYLYVKRYGGYSGPANFTKVGTGYGGTLAGTKYGVLGAGIYSDSISAFYLDGYVYNGYTTDGNTIERQNVATGAITYVNLGSSAKLYRRSNAAELTGANSAAERADLLLTTDGRYVYNIGFEGTTDWKVRVFDTLNGWAKVADFTTVMAGFSAYETSGFIADGFYIYPIESVYYYNGSYGWGYWPSDSSRVTRIGTGLNGTTAGEIVNQWYEGATDEFEINGQYDALNRKVWMGRMQGGATIYRFGAPDESASAGTYTSRVFDMGPGATTGDISWSESVPGGTSLIIETRVSSARTFSTEDNTVTSDWQTATNSAAIPTPSPAVPGARYIQYRVTMTGPGGATSPSLDDITIKFTPATPGHAALETWRVIDMTDGQYKLRVTGRDLAGNEVTREADPVYVDKTPPEASFNKLLNLDGNDTGYVSGANVAMSGSAGDTNFGTWTVEQKPAGATSWSPISTGSSATTDFGSWDTTAVSEDTEPRQVRLRVTDKADNTAFSLGLSATGGTKTIVGDYTVQTFTSNGTFQVTSGAGNAEVLVVAGGGGGGSDMGGGGGGGGVIYDPAKSISVGSYAVAVGTGGTGAPTGTGQPKGTNGGNSTFDSATAIGGGGGASSHNVNTSPAGNGGSGGGASGAGGLYGYGGAFGLGTSGQGFDGGGSAGMWYPGGGGGAGQVGSTAPAKGGGGVQNSILGTSYFWGGGGGGSGYSDIGGDGGPGGGGGGAVGTTYGGGGGLHNGSPGGGGSTNDQTNRPGGNAGVNTGGGGGGGSHYNSTNNGGNGASGLVVIKYVESAGYPSVYIDNTAPVVTSTIPDTDATNVDPSKNITAYFDDLMYAPSISSGSFLLNSGAVSPASVIYLDQLNSSYATFRLAAPLDMNTTYQADLTTAMHNRAGLPVAAHSWSFTTAKVDAALYQPLANAHVSGTYPVMGRSTGSQFGGYKLEYAAGRHDALYGGPWTQIGNTGTQTVTSQRNIQTDWSTGVNTSPVNFSTTATEYYSKDSNVITNSGYNQLGNSNVKWLSGAWSTRKPVTIDNSASATALTDYQVQITVPYESGMRADFRDLRFTETDGQTDLNYWIEKYTASTNATVWVKVPTVPAGASQTIYMYYGNAGAPAAEKPADTFDFFDGFDGNATIDPVKWNTTSALGFIQAGTKSRLTALTTGGRLTSNAAFSYPVVLEAREISAYLPPNGISALGFFGSSSDSFGILHYPGATKYYNDGAWIDIGNLMGEDTWYRLSLQPQGRFRARYIIADDTSGSVLRDETVTNEVTGEPIALGRRYDDTLSEPTSTSWDWVLVRKYTATIPTVTIGSTDDYQASGSLTSVVFDGGAATDWQMISWTENVPRGANITLETRTGDVPDPNDPSWTAWSDPSTYAGGTKIPVLQQGKRYIQYKADFFGNGATLLDTTIWHTPLIAWDTKDANSDGYEDDPLTDGAYTLRLVTTDTADDWTDAHVQKQAVVVNVDNAKPTVTFTDPVDDNQITTNMKTVTGTATDTDASVRKIEFQVASGDWKIAVGSSRVNENTADASYTGAWTTSTGHEPSDGSLKFTTTPGSAVTYTFTGSAVNWVSTRGPDRGQASVQVDGDPALTVDLYNTDELFQQTVFTATGLNPNISHTLSITATGLSDPASTGIRVDVDAFETGGTVPWSFDWVTNPGTPMGVDDGTHNIAARATDGAGNISDSAGRTIKTDNTDPSADITSPAADSAFTTDQPVVGTANDTNFDHYVLDYSYGPNAENWLPIATGSSPIDAGQLGTWTAPKRTPLFDWQTDGDSMNWCPQQGITNISVSDSSFNGRTTGTAPYFMKTPEKLTINGNETKILKIKMKVSDASGYAKLFWKYSYPNWGSYLTISNMYLPLGEPVTSTAEDEWGYPLKSGATQFGESRRMIKWPVVNAGQWVEYTVDMSLGRVYIEDDPQHDKTHPLVDYSLVWPNTGFWAGTVYQLRFDPTDIPDVNFNIDYMSLGSADGNYKIRLKSYDKVGRSTTDDVYPVIIDRNTPACIIKTPINMTFLPSGDNVEITGSAADDLVNGVASGIDKVEYRVIQNVDSFAPTVGPWLPATGTTSWTAAVNLPAGWHGLQARAFDKAGNTQESNYSYVTVDDTPPPVPRLRSMADRSRGGILLSWTPVKDTGSGTDYYVLYRGSNPVTTGVQYPDGTAIELADSELVTKDFGNGPETFRAFHASNAIDTAFQPNANIRYYVRAVDNVGHASAKASISALYDTLAPSTPTNLTAARAGATTSATLAWTASTDNQAIAEYRIYRVVKPPSAPEPFDFTPDAGNQIGVAQVAGTFFTTKFFDSNLAENTNYCYKVVAYDDSLIPSAASNIAETDIGVKGTYTDRLPHKTFSKNSDQCVICHRTHTGPGKDLLKRQYEANLCYTCHDGTGSNTPTQAEFDYAPSGLHRVKDTIWPNGALSCVDCHNPHLNTQNASFENFDSTPLGLITDATKPKGWMLTGGAWTATGDATHVELSQTAGSVTSLATFDTGIDIAAVGGYFQTEIRFDAASTGQAFFTVAGDGTTPGAGVTLALDKNAGKYQLFSSGSLLREQTVALAQGTTYRIKLKLDEEKTLNANLYSVAKSDLPTGHDTITDTLVSTLKYQLVTGDYKGSYVAVGTDNALASFDVVRVNSPGMLQNRYRKFYKNGSAAEYTVPDDRVMTEAFCLSCHGTSSDSPGGSQTQYYTSIHNPLMGGMNDQALDQDVSSQVKTNPATITPRWQTIRDEWRDIKNNPLYKLSDGRSIGDLLKNTANGCLYCHGYHGQQFYDKNQKGEEELCYTCHGRAANFSRDSWNIYRQYSGYVEDTSARISYSGNWVKRTGGQYGGGSTMVYSGPPANWYDLGWSKRKQITVSNSNGALTNFQVKLNIGYDGAMKSDFGDLRFVSSDGVTLLPYWVESYTASATAIIWVKVPNLPANGNATIFMYYGNSAVSSASDGLGVFDFFDDFSDGSIDPAKWTLYDPYSFLSESGGTMNSSGGYGWGYSTFYSTPNLSRPFVLEFRHLYTGGNYNMSGIKNTGGGINYPDLIYGGHTAYDGSGNRMLVLENGNSRGDQLRTISASNWNYFKWNVLPTGAVYYHGNEPQNYVQYYNSTYSSEDPVKLGFVGCNEVCKFDDVRVRKYTAVEPGASFGAVELQGGATYTFDSSFVTVYSQTGPGRGQFRVFVDNNDEGLVDLAAFPAGTDTAVFTRTGLASGTRHTLDIMPVIGSGEVDLDSVKGSASQHGLTLLEATIKCTSCHGQRAMTDRHVYEGYPTSIITNPNNIKQYWSDLRTQGKTINDYCNACHKEADRKGRVLIETHTSSKIVPYTVKYPPMVTTPSANGFDRTGYTLGDAYTAQENFPGVTVNNPADWTIDATPGNQYDGDAARYSDVSLAWLEYGFQGSSVTWVTKKSSSYGIAQVFIDGTRINDGDTQLTGDSGNNKSGFDLYNGVDLWTNAIYTRSGLDPTQNHTIRIIVTGSKNNASSGYRIDVDAFRYTVPRVGHYLYAPVSGNCAGTCHDTLPEYIRDSQEARTKITCTTCHHPHASDNARLVHQPEDYTEPNGTVHKGACLHCHDGSVTK